MISSGDFSPLLESLCCAYGSLNIHRRTERESVNDVGDVSYGVGGMGCIYCVLN